ncbi:hypothetical protein MOQ_006948, partial [Trypanosoma cruzi marinkellei]
MEWCALSMNEGRGQLNCFCDEYWLRFPWTNNPRGVRGSLPFMVTLLLCCCGRCTHSRVCVPSVRGADTTDRSRRMCMRWSLVCRSCLILPPPSVCWCCGRAVCVCARCRCWAAAICDCAVAVRGVAAVSLLLLLLCVDGVLVCAEGYTQVTGVMAMMMAGRVLLVCALCVLWCGAGCGCAWDFGTKELNEYYYGPNGTFCKVFPKVYACEARMNASKRQAATPLPEAVQSGTGGGQTTGGGSSEGPEQ